MHLAMDYASVFMASGSTPSFYYELKHATLTGKTLPARKLFILVALKNRLIQFYSQKISARKMALKTRSTIASNLMYAKPKLSASDARVYYATLTVMIARQCTEDFSIGLERIFENSGITARHYFTCNAALYEPDILHKHSPDKMQKHLNKLLHYYTRQTHALLMHIDKITNQYLNPNSHDL
jgi:hypothetical protein